MQPVRKKNNLGTVNPPVPQLLERLRGGDQSVIDQLTVALYDELRRIAARHLRGERPGRTLQTTALVHEAYLKLCGQPERQFADRIPRPPLSALIDHIDHIAKVAGVDHVGLGSDFDGVDGQLPQGIDSVADLPKITAALMERGYSAEDCRKILGGNLLRVFREVQAVAKELQAENRPRITDRQPFDKPQKQ